MKSYFKFDVLDTVKDNVTGFEGVVTAMSVYLDGIVMYLVEKVLSNIDQEPVSQWITSDRLDAV